MCEWDRYKMLVVSKARSDVSNECSHAPQSQFRGFYWSILIRLGGFLSTEFLSLVMRRNYSDIPKWLSFTLVSFGFVTLIQVRIWHLLNIVMSFVLFMDLILFYPLLLRSLYFKCLTVKTLGSCGLSSWVQF